MDSSPLPRVYWITDTRTYGREQILRHFERLLDQGLPMIQIREKHLAEPGLARFVEEIRKRSESYDIKCILNGGPERAARWNLDGYHLPEEQYATRKRSLPGNIIAGCSLHSAEAVRRLSPGGVTYCSLSPVFAPGSKHSEISPLGLEELRTAAGGGKVPVFALGGITADRLEPVLETGCYGAAFISGLVKPDAMPKIMKVLNEFYNR